MDTDVPTTDNAPADLTQELLSLMEEDAALLDGFEGTVEDGLTSQATCNSTGYIEATSSTAITLSNGNDYILHIGTNSLRSLGFGRGNYTFEQASNSTVVVMPF